MTRTPAVLTDARIKSTLEQALRDLRQPSPVASEREPDMLDELLRQSELETAAQDCDRVAHLRRQITDALRRLECGEYGYCVDCGELIPLKRLRAVPWAERCVKHQEAKELREESRQ